MYKNEIKTAVCSLVAVVIIFTLLAFFIVKTETSNSNNLYNNGICTICGGQYKFLQAVGHHYDTYYIYRCNQCGELVETNIYFHN